MEKKKDGRGGARPGAGRKRIIDPSIKKYYDAYNLQRQHAGYRNIEWHFTFESWLAWWGEDIDKRGRTSGKLCMARYEDKGPYHPDNVQKLTVAENQKERIELVMRTPEFRELKRQQAILQHAEGRGKGAKKRLQTV